MSNKSENRVYRKKRQVKNVVLRNRFIILTSGLIFYFSRYTFKNKIAIVIQKNKDNCIKPSNNTSGYYNTEQTKKRYPQ